MSVGRHPMHTVEILSLCGISFGKLASYAFGKTLHVNVDIFMAIAEYFYLHENKHPSYRIHDFKNVSYMQVEL